MIARRRLAGLAFAFRRRKPDGGWARIHETADYASLIRFTG